MRWIFVGASTIASQHMIGAVRAQDGADVKWIVSGSADRVERYANEHGIAHFTTSLDEALGDESSACV